MLTHGGIEANPEKCTAIIEMQSPNNIIEVQRLIGCLTAISRFLPKLAEQTQPIIQLLKKSAKFSWNDEYEQVFQNLKTTLTSPPTPPRLHHRIKSHCKRNVGPRNHWYPTLCILR